MQLTYKRNLHSDMAPRSQAKLESSVAAFEKFAESVGPKLIGLSSTEVRVRLILPRSVLTPLLRSRYFACTYLFCCAGKDKGCS